MWKNAMLQPQWEGHELHSCRLSSLIRACRAGLACEELTPRSFPQGSFSTLDTEYDENKSRARAPAPHEPSPLYMYRWTCDQVNYPCWVVGLVVLSKLPHIL